MTSRRVTILGSTGSIGTQALEVIDAAGEGFEVLGLAATGRQPELLAGQVRRTGASVVAITEPTAEAEVRRQLGSWRVELLVGPDAAAELASRPAGVVLNGVAGAAGLAATLAAVAAGNRVGLANKESLTVGGSLVLRQLADRFPGRPAYEQLLPVDSEHSALWQCLAGTPKQVARLVLTASGGPFRGLDPDSLRDVTPAEALRHPTWHMGPLVTVNSATLVNKGLELIEAALLFGELLPGDPFGAIDVVVHPQSLVHSMVTYADGSTLAQLSPPDMRLPISLALGYPERIPGAAPAMDWTTSQSLSFEPLNSTTFPAVDLARAAGRLGGTAPAVFTAANEAAVSQFLAGNARFTSIVEVVEAVLGEHAGRDHVATPSLEDILDADCQARRRVRELLRGSAEVLA